MNTLEILDRLQSDANHDKKLREELLATRTMENPVSEFCRTARAHGYELYEMEVIAAGEEFHAQMKRSTNGGGENSPALEGEDDYYELFFAGLIQNEASYTV